MEVEAKFAADADVLRRLAAAGSLAGYALGEPRRVELTTSTWTRPARHCCKAGYACRRRAGDKGVAIQVKSLSSGGGGVHRREEHEVCPGEGRRAARLARRRGPRPGAAHRRRGAAADRWWSCARRACCGRSAKAEREVAELSLDEVTVSGPHGALPAYQEVEVELRPEGSEEDLAAMVAELQRRVEAAAGGAGQVQPRPGGGQGRLAADAATEEPGRPDAATGAAHTRDGWRAAPSPKPTAPRWTSWRRAPARPPVMRRPCSIWTTGVSQAEVGTRLGVTERTVRRWLRAYRRDGVAAVTAVDEATEPKRAGTAAATVAPPSRPGLTATDTMAAAAVKTLRFHFERMLAHEEGTRSGDDPEDLHDMRVATRRMRAALRVFEGHLDPTALAPHRARPAPHRPHAGRRARPGRLPREDACATSTRCRRSAAASSTRCWTPGGPSARRPAPAARLPGRRALPALRRALRAFLEQPAAGELPALTSAARRSPHRVADVLPAVTYERLAAVWAYAGPLAEPAPPLVRYHRLRIAGKFLRYTLEFFEEVLGPDAKPLIRAVKELQDHLGDLQDAVVSCAVLRTFLTWGTWRVPEHAGRTSPPGIVAPGVAVYLAFRQQELQRLLETFPQTWEKVNGPEFGRRLAAVLAAVRG